MHGKVDPIAPRLIGHEREGLLVAPCGHTIDRTRGQDEDLAGSTSATETLRRAECSTLVILRGRGSLFLIVKVRSAGSAVNSLRKTAGMGSIAIRGTT